MNRERSCARSNISFARCFVIILGVGKVELGLVLTVSIVATPVRVPRSGVDGRRSDASHELNKQQSALRVATNVPAILPDWCCVLLVVVDRRHSAVWSLDVPVCCGLVVVSVGFTKELHELVVGGRHVANKGGAVDVDVVLINFDHENSISLLKGQDNRLGLRPKDFFPLLVRHSRLDELSLRRREVGESFLEKDTSSVVLVKLLLSDVKLHAAKLAR